jgi:hypothetical protein
MKRILTSFMLMMSFLSVSVFAEATAVAAPDTALIHTGITNVFGAVLGVAVLIFGFKKIKSLL